MYKTPNRQLIRAAQMPLAHLGGIVRREDAMTVALLRSSISGVRHRVTSEPVGPKARRVWRVSHAISLPQMGL